jgi:type IV pilus assembly protein PilF
MRRDWLLALLVLVLAGCASGGGERGAPATTSNKLSADGRMNLGLAQGYLEENQLKKATDRANMALASDPGSADVHALFAMIHTREGKLDKAQREFDRALRIAPADGSILNAHASWLCERGQAAKADLEFAQALQDAGYRFPLQALTNAGKCAHKAGQWAKAEGYFRRALEIAPEERQVLLLLADSELQQGKIMEAQAFVQRRDALGSDAATLELAARIEDAAGNRMAAARYRQKLHDEFPGYVPVAQKSPTP